MLPTPTVPPSLLRLLNHFWPCFTRPTFTTFTALVTGMIAQTGPRSVCGMLTGAGLARAWPHDRAHAFFSRRRWNPHHLCEVLARLITAAFTTGGQELTLAIDDTLIKRSGRHVAHRARQHDGARRGPFPFSFGVCFIVAALVVDIAGRTRPMALPALIACHRPQARPPHRGRTGPRSPRPHPGSARPAATAATARILTHREKRRDRARFRLEQRRAKEAALPPGHRLPGTVPDLETPLAQAEAELARARHAHDQALARVREHTAPRPGPPPPLEREPTKTETAIALALRLAALFADRTVHVVADAAYHNPALQVLPANLTWTFRLMSNAVLYAAPAPAGPGRRGRRPHAGARLGTSADIAATAAFTPTAPGHPSAAVAALECRWPRSLGPTPLRLVLIRTTHRTAGYDLALLTTDTASPAAEVAARYARRWPIEATFQDARAHLGLEQARNRTPAAVERTVPVQFMAYSLVVVWYHRHGDGRGDVAARVDRRPWYAAKTEPAFSDMIAALRRVIIKHRISRSTSDQHISGLIEEIVLEQANTAA